LISDNPKMKKKEIARQAGIGISSLYRILSDA